MLYIESNKPHEFNLYIIKKVKADLKKSAFTLNPYFIFKNKRYTLKQCIDSLYVNKKTGIITYKEIYPVKHLIYNNRQLFWLSVLEDYNNNLNYYYMIWRSENVSITKR